jgi:biopolymer transport protein ExbD
MDITPMIDCTFLLLIFFLVASRMDATVALNLPLAKHGGAVVIQQSVVLTVLKGNGELAAVYEGDTPDPAKAIEGGTAADQETAVTAYVERELARSSELKYVLIKAEADVKHRDVARVAKAASQAEIQQLYIGVWEKK